MVHPCFGLGSCCTSHTQMRLVNPCVLLAFMDVWHHWQPIRKCFRAEFKSYFIIYLYSVQIFLGFSSIHFVAESMCQDDLWGGRYESSMFALVFLYISWVVKCWTKQSWCCKTVITGMIFFLQQQLLCEPVLGDCCVLPAMLLQLKQSDLQVFPKLLWSAKTKNATICRKHVCVPEPPAAGLPLHTCTHPLSQPSARFQGVWLAWDPPAPSPDSVQCPCPAVWDVLPCFAFAESCTGCFILCQLTLLYRRTTIHCDSDSSRKNLVNPYKLPTIPA